jgi:hypothetical protein
MQKRRKGEKRERPSSDQALVIPGGFPSTLNYPDNFPIIYRERSQLLIDATKPLSWKGVRFETKPKKDVLEKVIREWDKYGIS